MSKAYLIVFIAISTSKSFRKEKDMDICQNKKTGKTFIHLLERNNKEALMITPDGELKVLENQLFTDPVEIDDAEKLLARGDISRSQYNVYQIHGQDS
jgi:hypothetical protein